MNIFVLDDDIEKCARYHCDKHVVKMILESAQMLSTVSRENGGEIGYKVVHKNHPCTKWVAESLDNWLWLQKLTMYLNSEYRYRYDKEINHKSYNVACSLTRPDIPSIGLTPFKLAMPEEYKHKDAIKAYRDYYWYEKNNLLEWTRREVPDWIWTY